MDSNSDDVSAELPTETTPLLKSEISSSKDTTVSSFTSGGKYLSTKETVPLDAEAGPSRTTTEITEPRSAAETTERCSFDISKIVKAVFLTLCTAWPLMFLVLGIKYFGKCPAISSLPLLAILGGFFGVIPIVMQVIKTYRPNSYCSDGSHYKYALLIQEMAFAVIFIAYNCVLYSMEPNFDSTREDYCDRFFYKFNFAFNILSIVSVTWVSVSPCTLSHEGYYLGRGKGPCGEGYTAKELRVSLVTALRYVLPKAALEVEGLGSELLGGGDSFISRNSPWLRPWTVRGSTLWVFPHCLALKNPPVVPLGRLEKCGNSGPGGGPDGTGRNQTPK
ncbi:uncharacterized protein TNCT_484491 [Trichonephila clavata]|uniref:Uncharacterized protein n=1 Tax=Trichonephila clavata TaxID=2740835 RepID=A0A8X6FFI6_TRICU|nr:uncharacterized protein TNCT_484491 [Trichonephila clavata]